MSDLRHYDVGDVAVIDASFTDADTAVDPASVVAKVRDPEGTVTTYTYPDSPEFGRVNVGIYFVEVPVTSAGWWRYRIEGSAPAQGAATGIFAADPDPFDSEYASASRRSLCTLEEAKEYAGEPLDETRYDLLFRRLIDDCSVAFYDYCHREFVPIHAPADPPTVWERAFDLGSWERRERKVLIGDVASTTGLAVSTSYYDGTPIETVPAESIVALPRVRNGWEPITELWFPSRVAVPATLMQNTLMTVAADWGFPEVPGDVRQYAALQVSIWFARDVAKFSGTFSLAEGRTIRPRALDDAVRDGLDLGWRVPGL